MDIFFTQSSPLSDASSSSSSIYATAPALAGGFHSHHEEILLATSRPKKRAGRKIFKETRHPVYRGVRKRNVNKWVCELREPNKKSRIWLGTYPTPEMAARAHDVAALALRGKSACLNFADSAWRLPVPASADAREIRRVSGEAAELFRPQEFGGRDQNSAQNVCSEEDSSEEFENSRENALFIDEEEVFDMPRLLAEMAEGLLLSPPFFDGDGTTGWNLLENDFNVSLWSY